MYEKIIQYVVDEDLAKKIREIHLIISEGGHGKVSLSEEYLKPAEMREILGISERTEWNWIEKKILLPVRIKNKRYYRRSDIEKLLSVDQDDSTNK
jgi:hypothetical protein